MGDNEEQERLLRAVEEMFSAPVPGEVARVPLDDWSSRPPRICVYPYHRIVRFVPNDEVGLPVVQGPGPPFAVWVESAVACLEDSVARGAVWGDGYAEQTGVIVGRVTLGQCVLPACVRPTARTAHVTWKGEARRMREYEVLLVLRGRAEWVAASDGDVPAYAFPSGLGVDGEEVYAARVHYRGRFIFGRVMVSEGICLIAADNKVQAFNRYEVLVVFP